MPMEKEVPYFHIRGWYLSCQWSMRSWSYDGKFHEDMNLMHFGSQKSKLTTRN